MATYQLYCSRCGATGTAVFLRRGLEMDIEIFGNFIYEREPDGLRVILPTSVIICCAVCYQKARRRKALPQRLDHDRAELIAQS
jgi:hypothetical protein